MLLCYTILGRDRGHVHDRHDQPARGARPQGNNNNIINPKYQHTLSILLSLSIHPLTYPPPPLPLPCPLLFVTPPALLTRPQDRQRGSCGRTIRRRSHPPIRGKGGSKGGVVR